MSHANKICSSLYYAVIKSALFLILLLSAFTVSRGQCSLEIV
jgi:hypothetical protein